MNRATLRQSPRRGECVLLVPTLCVGTSHWTLGTVVEDDAERRKQCVPTQSVGTRSPVELR